MKNITTPSLRRIIFLTAAFVAISNLPAASNSTAADPAAQLLASRGVVWVHNVGRYVERGTFRIQVSAKLGRPDVELSDGTWLYHERTVEGSSARGTLIVRFGQGRVSELAVATPAVVAALRADPRKPLSAEMVASK